MSIVETAPRVLKLLVGALLVASMLPLGALSVAAQAGTTVELSPTAVNLDPDATGSVDVYVKNVTATVGLAAYTLTVTFDKDVVNVTGVTGGEAPFTSNPTVNMGVAGEVKFNSLITDYPGFKGASVRLARINLKAVGAAGATSALTFKAPITLKDADADPIAAAGVNGTVNIKVATCSTCPTASNDAYSVAEDGTLTVNAATGVLANDTDPQTTTGMTAQKITDPANGLVTLAADGSLTYVPNADFTGTDTFTYKAKDANTNESAAATVTITVTAVNDAPVATADAKSTTEDPATPLSIPAADLLANDTKGGSSYESAQTLTLTIGASGTAISTQGGTVGLSGTTITYTPAQNFNGTDTFTYTVSDNGTTNGAADPKTAQGTVTVTVTEVNDAPVANTDAKTAVEDTPLSFPTSDLLANDTKGGGSDEAGQAIAVTAVSATSALGGIVVLNGTTVTYTPKPNTTGADSFTYTLQDSGTTNGSPDPKSVTGTVNVTVTEVNVAPTAGADTVGPTNEDTALSILATALLANDTKGPANEAGQTLTITAVSSPSAQGGTVAISGANVVYTPALNYNGTDTFTYTVMDNGTTNGAAAPLTAQATVTVTVNAVNDAPVATNDAYGAVLNTTLTVTAADGVLKNDTDVENNALTATKTAELNPANAGTLTFNANGSFTYVPTAGFSGVATFKYKANDGTLDSSEATVTIAFGPQTAPDSYVTDQGVTLTVTAANGVLKNDSDPQGNPITAAKVSGPTPANGGALTLNTDGSLTFVPAAGFVGNVTFTYKANNGTQDSIETTATIKVNGKPVAANDNYLVAEDGALNLATAPEIGVLANDTDPNSDTITAVATVNPTHGTLTLNANGSFTYTPAADYNGPDSFKYKANDGRLDSTEATVTITVTEVNDVPTASADTKITAEDTVLNIPAADLLANDSKGPANEAGQTLNITAVSAASTQGGTVSVANNVVTYTPALNFNGTDTFTYTITDNGTTNGTSDFKTSQATVTVTVTEVNDLPAAGNDAKTTNEDTVLTIPAADLLINDNAGPANEAGQTLTITAVSSPSAQGGTVAISGANVVYTPVLNFNGTDTFTYTVTDNGTTGGVPAPQSATATVTVTVNPVNDAPVANNDAYTAVLNTTLAVTAANGVLKNDTDVENDTLTATKTAELSPANAGTLTFDLTGTGAFTYVPTAGFSGVATFKYKANDGTVNSAEATVTISFGPLAAPDSYVTDQGVTLTVAAANGILANDSDPQGKAISANVTAAVTSGTLSLAADGSFIYTPAPGFVGTVTFKYRARNTDAQESIETTVTIKVNGKPVANNDVYSIAEDGTLTVTQANGVVANDTDPNSDTITAVATVNPTHGTLTLNANGSFTYTPAADYNGPDSFKYKANDGRLDSTEATVTITVTEVNDAPAAGADSKSTAEDTALNIPAADLLANDGKGPANEAGQTLNITAVSAASAQGGTVSVANNVVTYTPAQNFNGTDTFTYTITDNGTTNGQADPKTSQATVTVTVTEVNDLPATGNDAKTTNEDTVLNIPAADLITNDSPGPANEAAPTQTQTLTIVSVSTASAQGGTVAISGANVVYTPVLNFNGTDTFTYTVTDNGTTGGVPAPQSATATVTVTVNPVNDAPVAANDFYGFVKNNGLTVTAANGLLKNDADVDNTNLTARLVANIPAGTGTLTLNTDGSFTYTPAADFEGQVTFTYVANDGLLDSNTATVTLAAAKVRFHVLLQGRAGQSGQDWVSGFHVDFFTPGADRATATPVRSLDLNSDSQGFFEVPIQPGTYDIRVKGKHTLGVVKTGVAVNSATDPVLELGAQVEGDFDGNNVVDVTDYSAILANFGKLTSGLAADKKPLDFNQDGVVDISDYSIVLLNFGKAGQS